MAAKDQTAAVGGPPPRLDEASLPHLDDAARKRLLKAFEQCNRRIERASDSGAGYSLRAVFLREAGRLDEALADCNRAIALAPGAGGPFGVRAQVLRDLGRLDEAAEDWGRARELMSRAGNPFSGGDNAEPDVGMEWETAVSVLEFLERRHLIEAEKDELVSKETGYNPWGMSKAAELYAEALKLGYTFESALETLREKASAAARETTGRAKAKPRPDAAAPTTNATAPAVEWPSKKWKDADEKIRGKKLGILTFLEREWEPFIQKSGQVVTRDILAMHDPDAEQALTRHLERHDFPEGISIIYPKRLTNIASERPDLVHAALGAGRVSGLHK